MSNQFIPFDAVAVIPVSFVDQIGRPVAAPTSISFETSNSGAATISFDGSNITITPAGEGTATITAAGLAGEIDVTVGTPSAAGVSFGTAAFSAKA